jgi:hypothetical protein
VTRISELIVRGTHIRRERNYLAACIVIVTAYFGLLCWFQYVDDPFDKVFLAQREAVRITHVEQHPIKLNRVLPLVTEGHVVPAIELLDGWSVPESWGIWSDGSSAALAVSVPQNAQGALQLEVEARVILDDTGLQTIRVFANGVMVGTWQLRTTTATLRTDLPPAAIGLSHILRLTFEIAHPRQASHSADPRRLGIGVETLTIRSQAMSQ